MVRSRRTQTEPRTAPTIILSVFVIAIWYVTREGIECNLKAIYGTNGYVHVCSCVRCKMEWSKVPDNSFWAKVLQRTMTLECI